MSNLIYLVGRLDDNPNMKSLSDERKFVTINVSVPRQYKNEDGIYETDCILCSISSGIANNVYEYCKVGDLIGIKGRIQMKEQEDNLGNKNNVIEIVVDKFTYLSSQKEK